MTRDIPFTSTLQVMEHDRENWINKEHRHCRIGKVTRKPSYQLPHIFVPNVSPALERFPPWERPGTGYVNPLTSWTC